MAPRNLVLRSNRDLSLEQKQEYGFLHGIGHGYGLDSWESSDISHGCDADLMNVHGHSLGLAHSHVHHSSVSVIDENVVSPLLMHNCHLDQEDGYSNDDVDEVNLHTNEWVAGVENIEDHHPGFTNEHHKLLLSNMQDFDGNLERPDKHSRESSIVSASEIDIHEPESRLSSSPVGRPQSLVSASIHELHVGQEFPDAQSCRRALRDTAIALQFEIQTIKSDKTRFTAKCASEGCPWRIYAAKLAGASTFTIRTLNNDHTCDGLTGLGHQQATVQWVSNTVEQRLREDPNCKPKEILEEIYRVHGVALTYKQAWRGKERFFASIRGSFEDEYRILPHYTEQIQRSNPGSIALVYGSPVDNNFQRLFVSYQASIYGFLHGCRPLLGLDRISLKSKYLGGMLLAVGFDGDGGLFPVAFGVVDEETDDNWMWFLSELHNLLELNIEYMPKLTFLSDRQKGKVVGIEANFPSAFHGLCMKHLCENFQKEFNNITLIYLLWEAASALTIHDFENKILEIEEVSADAAYWIRRTPPRLWATAHFEGTRLGQFTANMADLESLQNWDPEFSGLPIVQMMESIRRQLMTWFNERREVSKQWTNTLVPYAERQITETIKIAQSYQVLRANEAEFEVISSEGTDIVDIRNRCCFCRGWQESGLPCSHAVAALLFCKQNVYRYAKNCFTVAKYRKTYSQTIHPIPDKSLWNENQPSSCSNIGSEIMMKPPKYLKQPPRRRKRLVRSDERAAVKRTVHCSHCKQSGHFRSTCAARI